MVFHPSIKTCAYDDDLTIDYMVDSVGENQPHYFCAPSKTGVMLLGIEQVFCRNKSWIEIRCIIKVRWASLSSGMPRLIQRSTW